MITIYIDNMPYKVKEGWNLLHACLSLGFDIPYFCWHPAMHSVGACRLCAVKEFKDEKDIQGKIIMSCMTAASEGMRISIDDPEAKAFRGSVIEWLMTNHPHDCPICDEGGECHLQDMTVMTGHVVRRFRFRKRTYNNQDLGPFLNHEMNRCIHCYRCVRFYREYAGGKDFDALAAHNHVYFGRHRDGALENEFSGNLVEICPTGVFTDKSLKKHYTRKWDLQTAPSVCVHCGLGCNTIPGERYGVLRRVHNRYHAEVNRYFLCDRGRYGYEFVNSGQRIRSTIIKDRERSNKNPSARTAVLKRLSTILHFGARAIGIGSPRASIESNFALRTLVGPENFFSGMSGQEHRLVSSIIEVMKKGPARSPSLLDVEASDAVLVLGEDVTNTAPILALALRQSVRNKQLERARKLGIPDWHDEAARTASQNEKSLLFIATPAATKLDDVSALAYRASPDDIARLGFAVARELSENAPPVPGLDGQMRATARAIAEGLRDAVRPLVVSGTGCGSEAMIHAAANTAWALHEKGKNAGLCFTVPECNSLGSGLMGGGSVAEAVQTVRDKGADAIIILENDLYRRARRSAVDDLFAGCGHCVVLDHTHSETTEKADIVLPVTTFAEADGDMVNNEGRMQRFFRVFMPEGDVREGWRWLRDIMVAAGRRGAEAWRGLDDVASAVAGTIPILGPIADAAPKAGFRVAGMKIPRQPHRYSGRTAMTAHISVREPQPPDDPDSPFSFSMEGYEGMPPPSLMARYWAPGWNSVQALNKFQEEIGGPLRGGDTGVRLIEPAEKRPAYFDDIPGPFQTRGEGLLIVLLYHIFGSEELSIRSPGIMQLSPGPFIALSEDYAARLGVREGDEMEIEVSDITRRLPARILPGLPQGIGGLPYGVPGLDVVDLPSWSKVKKVKESDE
jgi:NADH-quinone oxidoreductase subunit G